MLEVFFVVAILNILAYFLVVWDARRPHKKLVKDYYGKMKGWLEDYRTLKKVYGCDNEMTIEMREKIIHEWNFFDWLLEKNYDIRYSSKIVRELRPALFKEGITVNTSIIVY